MADQLLKLLQRQLDRMTVMSYTLFEKHDKTKRGAFISVFDSLSDITSNKNTHVMFIKQEDFAGIEYSTGDELIQSYDPESEIVVITSVTLDKASETGGAVLQGRIVKPVENKEVDDKVKKNSKFVEPLSMLMHDCAICGAATKKSCAKCHKVYYCCKEHQVDGWLYHKKECKKLAAQNVEEAVLLQSFK